MTPGYLALKEGAALLDLSARGRIKVTGEDRKRLLHAMTTNHVQGLATGGSLYAFFLNAQGRVLADVWMHALEDAIILDLEPEARERVYQHLDKFIIADDVTLEDITPATFELGVEGPKAQSLRANIPAGALAVIDASTTGQPGFRVIGAVEQKQSFLALLNEAGAFPVLPEEANAVRLENGQPRYGEDIDEAHIAHETGLLQAIHFSKGCYLGQEIVERVRSRGQVNRLLTRIVLDAAAAPPKGTKVLVGDKEAGEITSSAISPGESRVYALAYLRREALAPNAALSVNGATAQALPRG